METDSKVISNPPDAYLMVSSHKKSEALGIQSVIQGAVEGTVNEASLIHSGILANLKGKVIQDGQKPAATCSENQPSATPRKQSSDYLHGSPSTLQEDHQSNVAISEDGWELEGNLTGRGKRIQKTRSLNLPSY